MDKLTLKVIFKGKSKTVQTVQLSLKVFILVFKFEQKY
jgi:hypothetical protein